MILIEKNIIGRVLARALKLSALVGAMGLFGIANAQTDSKARSRIETINGKQFMLTSKLKSILVADFWYNWDHHTNGSPQLLIATLNRIGKTEGWTVDVTTDKQSITAAKLKSYNVLFASYISSWASSGSFPSASCTAVQEFVENQGGGLFIQHSSGDSRISNNWNWYYKTAHPIEYINESSRTTVSAPVFIPTAMKQHPIMDGISFGGKDTVIWPQGEWHIFSKKILDVVPSAQILLKMDAAHCTKGGSGSYCGDATAYRDPGGYPASWTFPDKKGNIGYFMEAHDDITMKAMTEAVWDKFYRQFMYYMAGYDTVAVTSVKPSTNPEENMALDRSGITFHSANQAGVLISKAGKHVVTLFDLAGHTLREIKGSSSPVDYDLTPDLQGARGGVYIMKVRVGGTVSQKRIILP